MGDQVDKLGKPILESYRDKVPRSSIILNEGAPVFWKEHAKADRGASMEDAMLMVDILLKGYESLYWRHAHDDRLLLLRHMFARPKEGDKIRNLTTNEVYEITDIIVDPISKTWEGVVRINATNTPPDPEAGQKIEFENDDRYVRFTHEFPQALGTDGQTADEYHKDDGPAPPAIVYALIRKEPGSIGRKPFAPNKQQAPLKRETLKSTNIPGHSMEIYGQWFDNLVQFDCWSTDNYSADCLATWFEKFMSLHSKVLKLNGVQQIWYWQRDRDAAVTKWRQDLISRAVQYYFRTEELSTVLQKDIVDIDWRLNLATETDYENERWIADQLVQDPEQLTYQQYQDLFRDSNGTYLFGTVLVNDGNLT